MVKKSGTALKFSYYLRGNINPVRYWIPLSQGGDLKGAAQYIYLRCKW